MTQKTKLEILGPYTPEYEGPFCTRDGRPVRLITKKDGSGKYPVVGYIEDALHPAVWCVNGDTYHKGPSRSGDDENDLMNASEVHVAREFWLVKHDREINQYSTYVTERAAQRVLGNTPDARAIIHVREVLPGEGA